MKKKVLFGLPVFILFASLLLSGSVYARHDWHWARTIDPIVSTEWLEANMDAENLVIIDIRGSAEYAAGHIPDSINEPFVTAFDPCTGPSSDWIIGTEDCLWLEVPDDTDLFSTIGSLGITHDSWVVIVTDPNPGEPPFYGLSNGTRVADTLIYAGVKDVAILDGGYAKWVAEERDIETGDGPEVTPVTYKGKVNRAMFVSINYVRRHLRSADIIDARDADVYFGLILEPFADKAGHIPWAKCLPAPWIWDLNTDETYTYYTYKVPETLSAMASGVLHEPWGCKGHWRQKITVYCGVGGYASTWWFVLTQILEYQNVKFYDGGAQEWVRYYDMVPYQWD